MEERHDQIHAVKGLLWWSVETQKVGQWGGGSRGCWGALATEGVDSRAGGRRSTGFAIHLERAALSGCERK